MHHGVKDATLSSLSFSIHQGKSLKTGNDTINKEMRRPRKVTLKVGYC